MNLTIHLDELQKICRRNNVAMLGVFGSVARGEDTETSDVDLLVRFQTPIGLMDFVALEREFAEVLEKPVDLVTEPSLHKYIRPNVMRDLKILYES